MTAPTRNTRRTRPTPAMRRALDTSTPTEPEAPPLADAVAQQTLILDLEIRKPSFRARVRSADVVHEDDDTDPNMLHISKDLLDRSVLAEILAEESRLKTYLRTRAVPNVPLRGGMHVIPMDKVKEVNEWVRAFQQLRGELVQDKLVAKYEEHITAAEKRLGPKHFNREQYPAASALTDAFACRVRWMALEVPTALKTISRKMYDEAQALVTTEMETARTDVMRALRGVAAQLVESLAERLGSDDGKPRTFRDNRVKKLLDFLDTFSGRNIAGDVELALLMGQARELLDGVVPDDLRKDDDTRERVREGMEAIKQALDTMPVSVRVRKFASAGEV